MPAGRTVTSVATCGSCGTEIDWALMPSGKRNPVDHHSAGDPNGTLAVKRLDDGTLAARVLKDGDQPEQDEKRGTSHFATCPDADKHRRGRG